MEDVVDEGSDLDGQSEVLGSDCVDRETGLFVQLPVRLREIITMYMIHGGSRFCCARNTYQLVDHTDDALQVIIRCQL